MNTRTEGKEDRIDAVVLITGEIETGRRIDRDRRLKISIEMKTNDF